MQDRLLVIRLGILVAANTCYMCDSVATSREHVPPACFFPKAKYIGRDLRRNLITVPSCDKHNSQKSKDDEFLRSVVLMSPESNEVGKHQFFRNFLRAIARMPHVFRSFFRDRGPVGRGQGRVFQVDRDRFDKCVDHMARAIFFDSFKRKWQLPISIVCPSFLRGIQSDRVLGDEPTNKASEVARGFLANEPIRGENPEVFKYQVRFDEVDGAYTFAAKFYDCFEVYSHSSREMTEGTV